ncbi:MAG TPA: hypothetical protein VK213_13950 [Bacteroidales bacterium]|nr:hypothetical protein [Bacteroidales bacterium]
MKKITLLSVLLFLLAVIPAVNAQENDTVSHYLFPDFTPGKILLKVGKSKSLPMNYNAATEEMVFVNNGQNLAIANIEDIDTVYIQNRKFIPVGKVFYEVAVTAKTPLLVQYTCSVIPPGKPAGYGTTTETASVEVVNNFFQSRQVYNLKIPGDYRIIPNVVFFLKSNDKYIRITNAKQVANVFPEKENAIKDFVKQNKTDFKDKKELANLIVFCNK